MTTIAQRPNTLTTSVVGVALAASLFGALVGGAVVVAVPAVIEARAADEAAQAEQAKWLKYGQDWEARYRQMYPIIK